MVVRRINVIGSSGSGKTTLARALAERLSLPHVELDGLFHQPGWVPAEAEAFQSQVADMAATERWVVDGNYTVARDILWARADTVIFIDLPRWQVMRQLVPRTVRRVVTREPLWNGNRERWKNLVSLDPMQSVVVWSWTRHSLQRQRYEAATVDPAWAHVRFIRLRTRARVEDCAMGCMG